jgi:ribose-phosphate pyrophosphokinase
MKDAVIIADLNSSAGEFARKVYENLKNRPEKLGVELNELVITKFRDCEIKPKIKNNVIRKKCYFIHDSAKNPNEWLAELLFVNETLRNSSAGEIIDVLPYLRYCRQDRKDESRVSISMKVVADCISTYADRAVTVDAHFNQIQGFFDIPFDNLYSSRTAADYLKEKYPDVLKNCVIMSPDAGGANRAEGFAKRFGVAEIAIGYKSRPRAGEIGKLKVIGDVKDKNVILLDDIIDSGKTLVKAAEECRKEGALNVYAYAAHGLFTNGTDLQGIEKIFTSDTVYRGNDKNVEVISMVGLFSEAIYRINEGKSISELFN